MITRKSTCGLCKSHKKWKKNNTKAKLEIRIVPQAGGVVSP